MYIYIYTYICKTHIYTYIYVHIYIAQPLGDMCIYIHIYKYIYTHVYIYTHITLTLTFSSLLALYTLCDVRALHAMEGKQLQINDEFHAFHCSVRSHAWRF